MTSRLYALSFDANDPPGLARFWAGVLRWEVADEPDDGVSLVPTDDTGFRLRSCRPRSRRSARTGCTSI